MVVEEREGLGPAVDVESQLAPGWEERNGGVALGSPGDETCNRPETGGRR